MARWRWQWTLTKVAETRKLSRKLDALEAKNLEVKNSRNSLEGNMQKYLAVVSVCWIFLLGAHLRAQQADFAFGGGSLYSAPANTNGNALPSMSGGTYLGFSGDLLFKGNLGIQGEVNWRATQGLYAGQIPYRPVLWDFNAIYSRRLSPRVGAEALGGIGGEAVRFYSGQANCDFYGNCTNYVSSHHFLVDVGGGVRLYVYHNFFVRPEARLYYILNNNGTGSINTYPGFSSNVALRYGAFIGYTFGGK